MIKNGYEKEIGWYVVLQLKIQSSFNIPQFVWCISRKKRKSGKDERKTSTLHTTWTKRAATVTSTSAALEKNNESFQQKYFLFQMTAFRNETFGVPAPLSFRMSHFLDLFLYFNENYSKKSDPKSLTLETFCISDSENQDMKSWKKKKMKAIATQFRYHRKAEREKERSLLGCALLLTWSIFIS